MLSPKTRKSVKLEGEFRWRYKGSFVKPIVFME